MFWAICVCFVHVLGRIGFLLFIFFVGCFPCLLAAVFKFLFSFIIDVESDLCSKKKDVESE